jgi:phosphate transport system substrate-binding protein
MERHKIGSILLLGVLFLGSAGAAPLSGTVRIDGSSTVYPVTEAVAEEFAKLHPKVRVTAGVSGTGGGMKKFTAGEIDIADASRPIQESERAVARKAGLEYVELPVAFDGIAVVVNAGNSFASHVTLEELKRIWQPGSTVKNWSDVRPGWPARKIKLYGPGADSGTFDYFTEAVVGESRKSRPDYTASEDDNVLVSGVEGDADALGYFGFAYYAQHRNRLKALAVDGGSGPVAPSHDTIRSLTYRPLSRPLLLYVSLRSLVRPEVAAFLEFYLQKGPELAEEVGYVRLPNAVREAALARFKARTSGTVLGLPNLPRTARLEELLRRTGEP